MTNFKNYLIAALTGLLALSLFTQPAQSAPKVYDQVKLINYQTCMEAQNDWQVATMTVNGGNGELSPMQNRSKCLWALK